MVSLYKQHLGQPSDIQEHLGLLHGLALESMQVVELGFRTGISTSAFLAAGTRVRSYDIDPKCKPYAQQLAKVHPKTFEFKLQDSRDCQPIECCTLFVDSAHTEECTLAEIDHWERYVLDWMVFHDTETFGSRDRPPGKGRGIWSAIHTFLGRKECDWKVWLHLRNCNGLTILKRCG